MKEATTPQGIWYRQMCCNFILIMCNTGMRPPEAKNLRWRDITKAKDKDGNVSGGMPPDTLPSHQTTIMKCSAT
jgi:integrase